MANVLLGTPKIDCSQFKINNFVSWLGNCLLDYVIIFASMIIARQLNHPLTYLFAIAVIGARQHALGLLAHDGAHGLAHKTRWINELFWRVLTAWVFMMGPDSYRKFHFGHHRFSTYDEDPEVISKHRAGQEDIWSLPRNKKDLTIGFLKDCLGFHLFKFSSIKNIDGIVPTSRTDIIGISSLWVLLVATVLTTGGWYYLLMWVVPMSTTLWAFQRIRVWSEHTGIHGTHRFNVTWWDSFFFFPHNAWCHWEHHEYPNVPFTHLPEIRKKDNRQPVLKSFGQLVELFAGSQYIKSGNVGLKIPGFSS